MSEEKRILNDRQSISNEPSSIGNENISQEQTIDQPGTKNPIQQSENMEVHHHPHLHHKPKRWKEYLLEFLMLFLAVTLGFFAENIREYYVQKENTKRFLETYRDELVQQQRLYDRYKKLYQTKVIVCDSIKLIFYNGEENQKLNILERLLVQGILNVDIPFNTSSHDQMVNSGALRYIHNIGLLDSMTAYRAQIENLKSYNNRVLQSIINNTFEISKLEDFHDVISTDTSQSYDAAQHVPVMKPFAPLSEEQRRSLIWFYESYIIQAQSDLKRLRLLYASNQNLLKMVNSQLEE
jgi:hypothetical protein